MMLLERFSPTWDFREVHSLPITTSSLTALRTLKAITPADVPFARFLMQLRSIPSFLAGGKAFIDERDAPILDQIIGRGFLLLAEDPQKEIVLGTIGRFWTPTGGFCLTVSSPEEFLSFDEPGWVKVGWNFMAEDSNEGCLLRTETRILATSRPARVKFALYWTMVRPGSGIIRRALLRSVRNRAEKHQNI